ncbi:CoA-transferase, partial [Palleronia sp.]|uniref:CoA-transferase n=1 Tax=Palleronia sp. TaxID=1940284 RepID=UPI0035C7B01C
AVGGAMDLVVGVPTIFVMMRHVNRDGSPKLLKRCTYPLTGLGVVSRVYTDLAVLDVTPDGFRLVELTPGNSLDAVQAVTEARILT